MLSIDTTSKPKGRGAARVCSREPGRRRWRPGWAGAGVAAVAVSLLLQSSIAARATTLECDSIRRLADNYLLDLRVRLVFDTFRHRYRRFEDAGRGWEEVATPGSYRKGRGERLILADNPYVDSYIERLTGAYYYIDSTGATLSVWGHCAASGPPYALF